MTSNGGNVEKMNLLLYIACDLDPRKKLDFVTYCFRKRYSLELASEMTKNVKRAFEELFDEYKRKSQPQFVDGESIQLGQVSHATSGFKSGKLKRKLIGF